MVKLRMIQIRMEKKTEDSAQLKPWSTSPKCHLSQTEPVLLEKVKCQGRWCDLLSLTAHIKGA